MHALKLGLLEQVGVQSVFKRVCRNAERRTQNAETPRQQDNKAVSIELQLYRYIHIITHRCCIALQINKTDYYASSLRIWSINRDVVSISIRPSAYPKR